MDDDNVYCDFYITHLTGGYVDADFIIGYNTSTNSFSLIDPRTDLTWNGGNFTWSVKTITLKNKFGGDYTDTYNVKGNISLDDTTFSQISYNGTVRHAESSTFPHYVVGQDLQNVYNYIRKWRNWEEDGYQNISRTLSSSQDYTCTATYARRYDITYRNYFNSADNGGTIKLKGTSHDSPYSTNFYEDSTYNLEAVNTTRNNVYYSFDHWEFQGSNIGSSNPYNSYSPTGGGILQAVFTHTPVNYYRHLTFNNNDYGHPVQLTWQKHDLDISFVTQYAVWRVVKHNGITSNPVQIGTVNATGASFYTFTDYDYAITNGYTNDLLHYDVRAYYNPNYSDPDFVAVCAEIAPSMLNGPIRNTSMASEKPTEHSISNYPNPFNPTTIINYQLPKNGFVTIKVYDVLGKEIATLVNENKSAGYYKVDFDASKLPSGVYFYNLTTGSNSITRKMLLMK